MPNGYGIYSLLTTLEFLNEIMLNKKNENNKLTIYQDFLELMTKLDPSFRRLKNSNVNVNKEKYFRLLD